MRSVTKNGVRIFFPQGFLDGTAAEELLSIDDVNRTVKSNPSMILVSLKKVIFFNTNGLEPFIKLFKIARKENHTAVGFCDYDLKKYNTILKFYKDDLMFSLFKTEKIAQLFATNYDNKNINVLLYNEDKSQRTAMAMELHDNGHTPIVAQSEKEFQEKIDSGTFDTIIETTYLGQIEQNVATRVTGNAIIYTVNAFLDAEIGESFNIDYHFHSLNVGFRLFIFDASKVVSMNVHAMNFFSKLASSGAEYNANICFVGMSFEKTQNEFKNTLEDAGIIFFEQMDDILKNKDMLSELGSSSIANIKQKRVINKVMINELPNFVNATVATIEMMTNSTAVKDAIQVNELSIKNTEGMIASSIGFYGDMDGMILLVFPVEIAKKACELLIGESTEDAELILDTLAELVNIVGGKLTTLLSDHDINVNITLPRTYPNVSSLLDIVKGKKGVQVDLSFDDDKFLFFLTR
ncbi:chemotaxis protein CheX [Sulfurimonas sp.]|uniref:chemotaxis protein CheX n=1 Tax=Sulfurimonas sp. TaxID=2022749 RepID=UPI0025FA9447|nr:chemotaxis protein CheX [Sulfurimonas sp.]MBT5934529.1 chemotaxis protein CheX [Sulfurimonas sp.]